MKKCKVENLIAIAAILGVLLLFGVFMFDTASGVLAACAAVFAVLGVAVALLWKKAKKPQAVLSAIAACAFSVVICGTFLLDVNAANSYEAGANNSTVTVTISDGGSGSREEITDGHTIKATTQCKHEADSCGDVSCKAGSVTVTITNNNAVKVTFMLKVTGTDKDISTAVSKELEPGKSLETTFTVSSGTCANNGTKEGYSGATTKTGVITITNVRLQENGDDVETKFSSGLHGSYTITFNNDQKENATETKTIKGVESFDKISTTPITQKSTTTYSLVATPDDGYEFFQWMSLKHGPISGDKEYVFDPREKEPDEVWPVFRVIGGPVFYIQGESRFDLYGNWVDAVTAAQKSSKKVMVLYNDATLPKGNYTIPSNVTVLIPFDEAGTVYENKPGYTGINQYHYGQKSYKCLTMADGAMLTVQGKLSIPAKRQISSSNSGGARGGALISDYGCIKMYKGSEIIVDEGGKLYAWGRIIAGATGNEGKVTVKDGGIVYETIQIADYRGGTDSTSSTMKNNRVFPFSQYYIQNIEVPLTLNAGAIEYCNFGIELTPVEICFVGDNTTSGLFNLSGEGSLQKDYLESSTRLELKVFGDVSIGSLNVPLKVAGTSVTSVNSGNYILPINNKITIDVQDGATLTVESQDLALLPDVEVYFRKGSVGKINSNLYLYNIADWKYANANNGGESSGGYCGANNGSGYSAGGGGFSPSQSAKVVFDGVVTVTGRLYATKGNGDFTASKSSSCAADKEVTASGNGVSIEVGKDGTAQLIYEPGDTKKETYTCQYVNIKNKEHYHQIPLVDVTLKGKNDVTLEGEGNYVYDANDETWGCGHTDKDGNDECDYCGQPACVHSEHRTKVDEDPATCNEDGTKEHWLCDRDKGGCGKIFLDENCENPATANDLRIPADHNWDDGEITTAPTCSAAGTKTFKCKEDGCDGIKTEAIEQIAHTIVIDEAVPATCTTTGLTEGKHCSVCETVLVAQTVVAKTSHTEATLPGTAATCTSTGVTEGKKCSVCHTVLVPQETIDKIPHNWDAGTITSEPTCEADGVKTFTCTICKSETKTESVPSTGHTDEVISAVAPTCTETGLTEGKKCSVCNTVLVQQTLVNELGHTEVIDTAVAPTCTENGLTEGKHCSVCNEVLVAQTVVDALGHTEVIDKAVAPTCTETGLTEGKHCSVCNAVLVAQETIDSSGHDKVTHEAKAPTCTEVGWDAYETCENCDYTTYEEIPSTGHTEEVDQAVAPTCTETGLTEGKHCSVCKAVIVKQEIVPALNHSYTSVVTDPTCTEQGYTTYTCIRGDHSYTDNMVPALDHSYNTVVTAPTCTEQGYTTYTCIRGDHSYVANYVNANGHTYGEPSHSWNGMTLTVTITCTVENCGHFLTGSATATEDDVVDRTDGNCQTYPSCKYSVTVKLNNTDYTFDTIIESEEFGDHVWNNGEQTLAPTCHSEGEMTYACTVNGCTETKTELIDKTDDHIDSDFDGVCDVDECEAILCVHEWGTPTYKWSENGGACIATRVCTKNDQHKQTVNATVSSKVEIEADCVNMGTTLYTATFNLEWEGIETQTTTRQDIPKKTTHTWDEGTFLEGDEPTCTENGTKTFCCTVEGCDAKKTQEEALLGHSYTTVVTDPTCTEKGYTTYTCIRGDHSYTDNYTDALTHDFGEWYTVIEVGCLTNGENRRDCKRDNCNAYETQVITAIGHNYDAVVTAPTCTEDGYTTHICANCGDSYKDTSVDHLGHSWNEGEMTQVPTCTEDGVKTYTCVRENCDEIKTEPVNSLGHTHGETVVENAEDATCSAEGSYDNVVYCTVCEEELSRETVMIDKIPHTEEIIPAVDPTCTETGLTEGKKCTVCDTVTQKQSTVNALGHIKVTDMAVTPTCTTDGKTEGAHCRRCNEVLAVSETIPATGHKPGNPVRFTITEATCIAEGLAQNVTYCSTCRTELHREDVAIPKTKHIGATVVQNVVSATCTAPGSYDEVFTCTTNGCDYTTTTHKTIDMLSHTPGQAVRENEHASTCTESGSYESVIYCVICSNEISREEIEIPTVAHQYVTEIERVPATCTVDGYYVRECECGKSETVTLTAYGHSYEASEIKEPTCEDDGYTIYACECGVSYKFIDDTALGHIDEDKNGRCDRENCGLDICEHEWTVTYVWTIDASSPETAVCVATGTCSKCGREKEARADWLSETILYRVEQKADCTTDGSMLFAAVFADSWLAFDLKEYDGQSYHAYEIVGVSAKHSSVKHIKAKDPTCTEDGNIEYWICHDCGRIFSDEDCTIEITDPTDIVKPATNHSYDDGVVTDPTCTTPGYTTYTCTVCGHSYTGNETQAAHNYTQINCWNEWEVWDECATCDGRVNVRARTYNVTIVDYWGNETVRENMIYDTYLWLNYSVSNVLEFDYPGWMIEDSNGDMRLVQWHEVWETFKEYSITGHDTTELRVYEATVATKVKPGAILMSVSYDNATSDKTMTVDLFIFVDSLGDNYKPIVKLGNSEAHLELKQIDESLNLYLVTIELSSYQITQGGENVQITIDYPGVAVKDPDKTIDSLLIVYQSALENYLKEIGKNASSDAQEAAILAVLNYGKAVQNYFGTGTSTWKFEKYEPEEIAQYENSTATEPATDGIITWVGANVSFKEDYQMIYTFKLEGEETRTPVSAVLFVYEFDENGQEMQEIGRYLVDVTERDAEERTYTVKYSVPASDIVKKNTAVKLMVYFADGGTHTSTEYKYGIYEYLTHSVYLYMERKDENQEPYHLKYVSGDTDGDKTNQYVQMLVSLLKLGEAVQRIQDVANQ